MKRESFNSLLIDRELGELTPETLELINAWLTEHPEFTSDIAPVQRTLAMTKTVMERFPELARPEDNIIVPPPGVFHANSLALVASLCVLLGGVTWLGFRAGRDSAQSKLVETKLRSTVHSQPHKSQPAGPWAHYGVVSAPRGGLMIVRQDAGNNL